jgi:UDP-N-acetylglucosamine 2-epimerase (non-hydrolysing)
MKRPVLVAGARPNFVKLGPLVHSLQRAGVPFDIVHTGQHYDAQMSDSFFSDLQIPKPTANFGVGSGSHAVQTAKVMTAFDEWLDTSETDLVVVFGDVNSTVACALVAAKRNLPIAHVEAGLRSFDRRMPEEVNRVLVDRIADWLLTPSRDANENLAAEGANPARVRLVGNIMVDSLEWAMKAGDQQVLDRLGVVPGGYALVTLHRAGLVDDPALLAGVLGVLGEFGADQPIVFPVHPRTRNMIAASGLALPSSIRLTDPLGYLEFVQLEASSRIVLTDSGGVQEETTCLGIPCLTLRDNTERPITVTEGTNRIVGTDPARIAAAYAEALTGVGTGRRPEMWDGHTADRIVDELSRPPAAGWQ